MWVFRLLVRRALQASTSKLEKAALRHEGPVLTEKGRPSQSRTSATTQLFGSEVGSLRENDVKYTVVRELGLRHLSWLKIKQNVLTQLGCECRLQSLHQRFDTTIKINAVLSAHHKKKKKKHSARNEVTALFRRQ